MTSDRDAPPEELSPTARVILGMITLDRRTGYDIKQFVDKTTRHFWAASYGQIYPELKRLEDRGLIRGNPDPSGGRARTVYELTDAGHAALLRWLESDEAAMSELRDEGMLKLFFSDALPERRVENIRAMRRVAERKLELLQGLEAHAGQEPTGPALTLQLGLASTRCVIDWCDTAERRLLAATETANPE
jgi:PadR family transcriptional regulator, regulatory protein AphA